MASFVRNSSLGKYVAAIRSAPPGYYNHRLLLTVLMFALAGMPKGWDEGSVASISQLRGFDQAFGLSPTVNLQQISNIVALVNVGAGVGAFLSFFLNDRVGRIWSYRIYMLVYMAGILIETLAYGNLPALYVGRIVAGLGIGSLTVVGPMAIVEIAPKATRGLMTLSFNICMLASQMTGIFVVYGCQVHLQDRLNLQWQIPFVVQFFVPTIGLVMSLFLYESPRWLALRGREEETATTLARLRGIDTDHPIYKYELEQILDQSLALRSEYGGLKSSMIIRETFCKMSNLRRVQLTITAYILAQMSGANAVTNYLPEIFGLVGIDGTNVKIYASGLYALAKVVCAFLAAFVFVDALGRRKSLFVGISVQIVCFSYLAGYLYDYTWNKNSVSHGASEGAIAFVYIHAFGWAVGLYTLPYLFGAELWPNHIRSFGGAVSQTFHWLFYFAITKATPYILTSMDNWGAFLFFAVWCLIAIIYVYFMVPETSGMALENINALFEGSMFAMGRAAALGPETSSKDDETVPDVETKYPAIHKEYAA